MTYIVIELQKTGDTLADLEYAYTDYNRVLEKYHKVLAAAAVSNVEVHSASVLDDTGVVMKNECFMHKI